MDEARYYDLTALHNAASEGYYEVQGFKGLERIYFDFCQQVQPDTLPSGAELCQRFDDSPRYGYLVGQGKEDGIRETCDALSGSIDEGSSQVYYSEVRNAAGLE